MELNFRGWTGKEMYDGIPVHNWYTQKGREMLVRIPDRGGLYAVEKYMQYMDLSDKNNKRYCQDDLVKYGKNIYRLVKGSYKFELVGFYDSYQENPHDFFSEGAYCDGEIVGNIYENVDLLQGSFER